MTVFVVQNQHQMNNTTGQLESKFDLRPAERFGELTFLLSPTARPFTPRPIVAELHRKLRGISLTDHLLLLGNPILIGMAVAVAQMHAREGSLSLLHWDGRAREYTPVRVDLLP